MSIICLIYFVPILSANSKNRTRLYIQIGSVFACILEIPFAISDS